MGIPIKYSYNPEYTPIKPVEYNEVKIELFDDESNDSLPFSFTSEVAMEEKLERTEILGIEKLPCKWKNVYSVKLCRRGTFVSGDTIGLIVPNSDSVVERLMSLCDIKDAVCRIYRTGKAPFTYKGTIKNFLKYKMDFTSIPRKIHLLNLARSSSLRSHVEYICSPEGAKDYVGFGTNWLTIVDIIEYFKCKPTLEDLIRNCDFIKARHYTLINGINDEYEILVGEIMKRAETAIKYGHVSGFINMLYYEKCDRGGLSGAQLQKTFIETTFRKNVMLGSVNTGCLICFCSGTGLALFLSLYNARREGQKIILIYGYRHDEDDITRLYNIDIEVIRAKSSEGDRVTKHCDVVEPYKNECRIVICGCPQMQRSVFLEVKRMYPEIVQEKRIHVDSWQ